MQLKFSILLITILAINWGSLGTTGASLQGTSDAQVANDLGSYLKKLAAEDRFSGTVLVAKNGKPIFQRAYGLADKNRQIRNRVDTRFNLGSMNKMFTAVAIAQLAERGSLSFSDTVEKHLPDYPNKSVAEKVTIHHLLTHKSGMGDYLNEKFYARLDQMRTVSDLLPLFVNDPLAFEPGESWDYSNAAFAVLGLIIEKVSGQSYFSYVKQHVFKRAGMTRTDYYEREQNIPDRAIGYMRVNAKGEPDPEAPRRENTSTRPAKGSPAGGAYSTVNDMLKFHIALRRNKLLSQKYTQLVTTSKVKVPPGWPMHEYGYGFTISVVNGKRIVGHGGTSLGVAGKFEMYPELGYTVVVLSNYELPAIMPVVAKTRELILK